jgi:hypothetical protein
MFINLKPINIYNNNKTVQDSSYIPTVLKLNTLKSDIFNKSVSFGSMTESNEPSYETLAYIRDEREKLNSMHLPSTSLYNYDLKKINDIHKGLKVFEGMVIDDLALLFDKVETILLQSGCRNRCSHCGAEAETKITTMKWENFEKLSDGINILIKRLGFNPLNSFNFYHDSDPMTFKLNDSKGKIYTIFDVAEKYYYATKTEHTNGIGTVITTAGWNPKNKILQEAADKLVLHPEYVENFSVSIGPYHGLMAKSINLLDESINYELLDPKKADKLKISSNKLKDQYIEIMANALKLSLKLPEEKRGVILLHHPRNSKKSDKYSFINSYKLFEEICEKLNKEGIDTSYFDKNIDAINFREISPTGRAKNLFTEAEFNRHEMQTNPLYRENLELDMNKPLNKELAKKYPLSIRPDGSIEAIISYSRSVRNKRLNIDGMPNLNFDNSVKIIKKIR